MKTIPKILIAHRDPGLRRRLVMLLAAAGCDVRSFATADAALAGARTEWFDLGLLDDGLPAQAAGGFSGQLRQIQPTLPLLLMVEKIELDQVVQGIRQGVSEVVAVADNPLPVLRHALALLDAEPAGSDGELGRELAALESADATLTDGTEEDGTRESAVRTLRLTQQNQFLALQARRLQEEKAGLQAELNALLAQSGEVQRLDGVLGSLAQERELIAATQEAIDAKARALTELRAAVASERSALACERERLAREAPGAGRTEPELTQARAELAGWRRRLEEEDDRLASDAARVRHESLQLAREKRRWHEDLDLIRAQETNLRAYECRLREMQAQLEAERVRLGGGAVPAQAARDEQTLREAWAKLQRASEILEAERKNFLDDRLNLREEAKAIRQREEKVRDREIKQSLREKSSPPVAVPPAKAKGLKKLTRAPFEAVRLAFQANPPA
jgi:DNA-binding NarL/FixJ family response regulator